MMRGVDPSTEGGESALGAGGALDLETMAAGVGIAEDPVDGIAVVSRGPTEWAESLPRKASRRLSLSKAASPGDIAAPEPTEESLRSIAMALDPSFATAPNRYHHIRGSLPAD
jgi:hypothetical protein